MSGDLKYMSIAVALEMGAATKSFEEVRIEDYRTAYQTTGRPPLPVPQQPTDENQRKLLHLPPLFKPTSEPSGSSGTSSALSTSSNALSASRGPRIVDPNDIPLGQEFRLHHVASETYHNIVCMPQYEHFSPDELRYYAYARNNIKSPFPITMHPFVYTPKETTTSSAAPGAPVEDKLQSLSAQPEYSKHSLEELRVAFMLAGGRQPTSNELIPGSVPPTALLPPTSTSAPPSLFGQPQQTQPSTTALSLFGQPTAPPSLFGQSTALVPQTTFGQPAPLAPAPTLIINPGPPVPASMGSASMIGAPTPTPMSATPTGTPTPQPLFAASQPKFSFGFR